ncbi:MAG: DUF2380 domain-containing protein [Methylotetracoccus sp.]
MQASRPIISWLAGGLLFGLAGLSSATETRRVAVLDFELNDLAGITPTPPPELERTASVAPLLRDALSRIGRYTVISIDPGATAEANHGFGYLFDHADEAARLGSQAGADIVVVGRVHKPSFLFAYLKVHVIDVAGARLIGDHVVEVKGQTKLATERGVARMAEQIDQTLDRATTR